MSATLPESLTSPVGLEREPRQTIEDARYGRSQLQLIWLRFVRNRAALVGGGVIVLLYLMAAFANFIAPYDADQRFDTAIYAPPQPIYVVDEGRVYPHVLGLTPRTDPETLLRTYMPDPTQK